MAKLEEKGKVVDLTFDVTDSKPGTITCELAVDCVIFNGLVPEEMFEEEPAVLERTLDKVGGRVESKLPLYVVALDATIEH